MINWATREIEAREWFAELAYATAALPRGAVTEALRPRLGERLRAAQRSLETARRASDADAEHAPVPVRAQRRSP